MARVTKLRAGLIYKNTSCFSKLSKMLSPNKQHGADPRDICYQGDQRTRAKRRQLLLEQRPLLQEESRRQVTGSGACPTWAAQTAARRGCAGRGLSPHRQIPRWRGTEVSPPHGRSSCSRTAEAGVLRTDAPHPSWASRPCTAGSQQDSRGLPWAMISFRDGSHLSRIRLIEERPRVCFTLPPTEPCSPGSWEGGWRQMP